MNRAIRICLGLSLAMGAASFAVYAVLGWVVASSTGAAGPFPTGYVVLVAAALLAGIALAAVPGT